MLGFWKIYGKFERKCERRRDGKKKDLKPKNYFLYHFKLV